MPCRPPGRATTATSRQCRAPSRNGSAWASASRFARSRGRKTRRFAGIVWEEEAVRSYFRGPPNSWGDAQIAHNILDKIPVKSVKGSEWDSDSVMECEFEPGLVSEPAQYFATGLKPGRSYQVGVRLYHADLRDETSLMVW